MMKVELRVVYEDTDLSPHQLASAFRNIYPAATVTVVTGKQVICAGMHRPVCPKCRVELRPERNGMGVLDLADWGPYTLWDSDLWKCPECGVEVIGGFGDGPISVYYRKDFQRLTAVYRKKGLLVENQG